MLKKLTTIVAMTISLAMSLPAMAKDAGPLIVDVLTLQDGKTYQDAAEYFDKVIPIIEGHGLTRLRSMEVLNKMQGHSAVSPAIVQIWVMETKNPFSGIFSDPKYLQHVELRDSIFNMPETQLWMATDRTAE